MQAESYVPLKYVLMDEPEVKAKTEHPSIMIDGKWYTADIDLGAHYGNLNAINGGRILKLAVYEEGETVGYWHNGTWEIPIPDMNAAAYLASLYFIERYNKMRDPEIERELTTHEHQC